jgi:hypothetical protein
MRVARSGLVILRLSADDLRSNDVELFPAAQLSTQTFGGLRAEFFRARRREYLAVLKSGSR